MTSFPKDFLWGAATSAHQIEGGNNNDWTRFENVPGNIAQGDKSGDAARGWDFYEADMELARQMHLNAYRFSIECSRVEPQKGVFDESAIEHYRDMLRVCRDKGLKPVVTLHHFTNPLWVADQDGWANPATILDFENFARRIVSEFQSEVDTWITFNEPLNVLGGGYLAGATPPGHRQDYDRFGQAAVNMLTAHARVYQMIHDVDQSPSKEGAVPCEVGIAHQMIVFTPRRVWSPLDWIGAAIAGFNYNDAVLQALETGVMNFYLPFTFSLHQKIPGLAHSYDFIGLNYYTRNQIDAFAPLKLHYKSSDTDMGWEIYPRGLSHFLRKLSRRYHKPIYVTENGIADGSRTKQADFLNAHVAELRKAMAKGADVRGYFYWSLMDNFEWNSGFAPRFGLLNVDYESPEKTRTLTPGAREYSRIIEKNGE